LSSLISTFRFENTYNSIAEDTFELELVPNLTIICLQIKTPLVDLSKLGT
jgi:hypothetical protein